jgi:hypothetical protein
LIPPVQEKPNGGPISSQNLDVHHWIVTHAPFEELTPDTTLSEKRVPIGFFGCLHRRILFGFR